MIKSGKVCSQLMKANNTDDTDIKVVRKYFWLTFVFNALKTSLNLCLSSFIDLSFFLIFEIRVVLSRKTCLEGGNLVKQIMHSPWCITGCSSNNFHQSHMQMTNMGGQKGLVLHENHGGMWSKGAWTWLKAKTSSGRTKMQARGWESLGGATCGACGHKSHKVKMIMLEKTEPGRDQRHPRPVGCDNPPRKIPYYHLKPIHFGH
jgi:hypothetical protein